MSLDITKLRSADNIQEGGNLVVYDAGADTLATVMAANYFDGAVNHLDVDDVIQVTHADGVTNLRVSAKGLASITVVGEKSSSVQALPGGGGAADLLTELTEVTSTGADVVTLADGLYIGQKKTINCVVDGGSVVVTPTTTLGAWSTCTLLAVGDSVTLEWNGTGWFALGVGAGTIALPIFA
jgi:acyl CoA:acetate/3-ketoacid CoA transferase beta subunit